MIGSFLFVTGTALTAQRAWPLSVGLGMITAAVTLVYYLRRSSLTKGMMFVFPVGEAKVEIETDVQVIQRNDK